MAGLVGHLVTVIGRVPDMVAAAEPPEPNVTAVTYYRADERFSAVSDAERVRVAAERSRPGTADLKEVSARVIRLCERQPPGRVVLTRHGDAMLLTEFMKTRVFETAVHGLDVADALRLDPWLTDEAADVVLDLLFERRPPTGQKDQLIRSATGRAPLRPGDRELFADHGFRELALG